mgnify:CR=1
INNILEGLNGIETIVFNRNIYQNNYFVTYQKKDRENLLNMLAQDRRIIVGPLYTFENYLELAQISNQYNN